MVKKKKKGTNWYNQWRQAEEPSMWMPQEELNLNEAEKCKCGSESQRSGGRS